MGSIKYLFEKMIHANKYDRSDTLHEIKESDGQTVEPHEHKDEELSIPAYLRYPDDEFSKLMFNGKMVEVTNLRCGYRFMLYTDIADNSPEVEPLSPAFDINETHYYHKDESSAWYSVGIMKHESVRTNSVCDWVDKQDGLLARFGALEKVLRIPPLLRGKTYKEVSMLDMGKNTTYNKIHGFDESHVYCRVFLLQDLIYKKFILLSKREDWSWRVEVNIPSEYEKIIPPDFVPAGQTFGRFTPIALFY